MRDWIKERIECNAEGLLRELHECAAHQAQLAELYIDEYKFAVEDDIWQSGGYFSVSKTASDVGKVLEREVVFRKDGNIIVRIFGSSPMDQQSSQIAVVSRRWDSVQGVCITETRLRGSDPEELGVEETVRLALEPLFFD